MRKRTTPDSLKLTFAALQSGQTLELNGWLLFYRSRNGLGICPLRSVGSGEFSRFFGYTGLDPAAELADLLARAATENATEWWHGRKAGVICAKPGPGVHGWGKCPCCGYALERVDGRAKCSSCRNNYPAPYREYVSGERPGLLTERGQVAAFVSTVHGEYLEKTRGTGTGIGEAFAEGFARELSGRLAGARMRTTPLSSSMPPHFWVEHAGFCFDCDCLAGVPRWEELAIFARALQGAATY